MMSNMSLQEETKIDQQLNFPEGTPIINGTEASFGPLVILKYTIL